MEEARQYVCERCHHTSNRKGDLVKHLLRKKSCPPSYSDVSCAELVQDIRLRRNDPSLSLACPACAKRFRTHQSIYQHKKHCAAFLLGRDRIETSFLMDTITKDDNTEIN
jgi:uncharacterized C2H2 Zn-finger protein